MKFIKKLIISLSIFLSIPLLVFAEDKTDPRLITVYGDAEVRVVPDEIILKLGVDTLNMDLSLAKKENDQRTKKILDVAREYKIEEKHIQTDFISISPEYDYSSKGRDEFIGYRVKKSIVLEIRDTSKFEDILSDILEAGAN
ncbi:MAG: SIMPL domain-containing protein, partial [Deltaproteobacteria bacterium]|nr:SIMPL domain-containing protein [Deltaproteobacteria bacterium]